MPDMKTGFSHPDVLDCDEVQRTIAGRTSEVVYVKELAQRVFPLRDANGNVSNCVRRLRRFIAGDPELLERMRQAGYRTRLPYLTQKQLRVLCEYV